MLDDVFHNSLPEGKDMLYICHFVVEWVLIFGMLVALSFCCTVHLVIGSQTA